MQVSKYLKRVVNVLYQFNVSVVWHWTIKCLLMGEKLKQKAPGLAMKLTNDLCLSDTDYKIFEWQQFISCMRSHYLLFCNIL